MEAETYSFLAMIGILVVYLILIGIGIVNYVLTSYSLYKIADNRGIKNSWLAWVPFGVNWVIGSICDYFDQLKGVNRRWRVALLTFSLITLGIITVLYIAAIAIIVAAIVSSEEPSEAQIISWLIGVYFVVLIELIVALALSVCQTICLYKIFEELAPNKAIKYIILFIIIPIIGAICLFKCKDSLVGVPEPVFPFEPPQPPQQPTTEN